QAARTVRDDDLRSRHPGAGPRRAAADRQRLRRPDGSRLLGDRSRARRGGRRGDAARVSAASSEPPDSRTARAAALGEHPVRTMTIATRTRPPDAVNARRVLGRDTRASSATRRRARSGSFRDRGWPSTIRLAGTPARVVPRALARAEPRRGPAGHDRLTQRRRRAEGRRTLRSFEDAQPATGPRPDEEKPSTGREGGDDGVDRARDGMPHAAHG